MLKTLEKTGRLYLITFIVVATCCLAVLRLQIPIADYPFLFPDSFDWLVNGLQYSGLVNERLVISHRGMFLSLLLSALLRINEIDYAVIIGTLFHAALAIILIPLLEGVATRSVALLTSFLCFVSFTLLGQSAYVGADVIAHFFLASFTILYLRFLQAPRSSHLYALAVLAGLGVHTQYIFPILSPFFLVAFVVALAGKSRKDLLSAILSRHGACSLLIFLGVVTLLFLPRLLAYHVIYEENVQHVSLIKFDLTGMRYFLAAYLVSFSWWIVLLALYGALIGVARGGQQRIMTWYALGWILNVFFFFAVLYSWKDLRFWLYGSVPTYLLAAIGLDDIIRRTKSRLIRIGVVLLTVYAAHATPTNDPWDNVLAVTPFSSFVFDGGLGGGFHPYRTLPYFYRHVREVRTTGEERVSGFSHPMRDTEAREALEAARKLSPEKPLAFFQPLPPDQYYIVSNRNKFYARSPVETIGDFSGIMRVIASDSAIVCDSARCKELESFVKGKGNIVDSQPLTSGAGAFRLLTLGRLDPSRSSDHVHSPTSHIETLSGGEDLLKALDGIDGVSENHATIPLHVPFVIEFSQAQSLAAVTVSLWSFDQREYQLSLTLIDVNGKTVKAPEFEKPVRGLIRVECGGEPIKRIEIVGESNSSVAWIPGNDYLHIQEVFLQSAPKNRD